MGAGIHHTDTEYTKIANKNAACPDFHPVPSRIRWPSPGCDVRYSSDHLFRIFLLKRFLECLSQLGDARLGKRDAIFVIVQRLVTAEP